MEAQLKLKTRASKQEIIDQYNQLLSAYNKNVKQYQESQKRLSEQEKHKQGQALEIANDVTVQSVIETLASLRGLIGNTINDLTDKMSSQAEQLENYRLSIDLQKKHLSKLYDIGNAADAYQKLADVYEERKSTAEEEYQKQMSELEAQYEARAQNLDRDYQTQQTTLQKEMEQLRLQWQEEQERVTKDRAREEAEYTYQRDRKRKLEADDYAEHKTAQEKELISLRETTQRELTERESAVAAREHELAEYKKKVETFPIQLQKDVEKARKETQTAVEKEMKQHESLTAVEHDWERKMYEQKTQHLESALANSEKKIEELRGELGIAQKQVNEVAKKAIDGASLAKAYQSVNQIALEQARRPDTKSTDR